MEGYPFKRLSHNGDSNGLSCFANGNGKKSQYAFKGRTNSSKTGGSIIFESWRWKGAICIIIACFLAADFMLQGKITTLLRHYDTTDSGKKPDPPVLEPKALRFVPNLTEILDSGDRVKFVPHKLLEKFREKNGGTNSTSDMEQRKRIPIKAPRLALVTRDLSKTPDILLLLTVAKALQALGYVLELYSLEDGPVRGVWEKMGTTTNILQCNQPFMIDWLNYDGVVVDSLEAKCVISSLMQDPFKVVPVVWIIHENSLGMRLRLYTSNEHRKHISDWKLAFGRADVVVFPDYAMPMVYSMLDCGNFFVIPGSPKETWEAEHFMAVHTRDEIQSKLGFTSFNFIIVVVGSPFSYPGVWKEHALVMEAIVPLIAEFNVDEGMNGSLRIAFVNNNLNHTYGVALQVIAQQLGFPAGVVQHICSDDDVNSIMSIADLVVYGSINEEQAFPSILLRAMSFKKPIIAPNLTIIKKYVEDSKHGLLFPLGDVRMMTKALTMAISSGKLSVQAHKIALEGSLQAKNLMASSSIEGYSAVLENILQLPSETAVPLPVSEIPGTIRETWQWHLIEETLESDEKYLKQDLKKTSIIFEVEELWTESPPQEDFSLNGSSVQEENFSLTDWKEEKEKKW